MTILNIVSFIILDFIKFIRHPSYNERCRTIDTHKPYYIILVAVVCYVMMYLTIMAISSVIIKPLKYLSLMPKDSISLDEGYKILIIILIAPIIEELMFRLPLIFSKRNLIISITLPILLLNKHNIGKALIIGITVCGTMFFLLYCKKIKFSDYLEQFWKKHFSFVFYFFTLLFGFVHILNFSNLSYTQYILSPLIILPQIIMGVYLGYARIRYDNGLIISMLIHIFLNTVSTFMLLLFTKYL